MILHSKEHRIFEVDRQPLKLLHVSRFVDTTSFKIEKVGLRRPEAHRLFNLSDERLGITDVVGNVAQIDIKCAQVWSESSFTQDPITPLARSGNSGSAGAVLGASSGGTQGSCILLNRVFFGLPTEDTCL